MSRVAVLGAGAWGTALALAFVRTGCRVVLWGRDAGAMHAMAASRENVARLPGVPLPAAIAITDDLATALAGADIMVLAVPTQALRILCQQLSALRTANLPIVLCAKGIERETGLFPSEILHAALPGTAVAVLSGPSFATDVARGLPTAVTLAAPRLGEAAALGAALGSPVLRLYHTDDLRGVEVGGAAKNVLAIACGIATGRSLGASAVAALIARAFAELSRLGAALGGRPETLAGLSGLGDLVLTCQSPQSRNFSLGLALGRGVPLAAAQGSAVVEGRWTAPILARLAAEARVDMPIATAVAAVLAGALDIDEAIASLTMRPLRAET